MKHANRNKKLSVLTSFFVFVFRWLTVLLEKCFLFVILTAKGRIRTLFTIYVRVFIPSYILQIHLFSNLTLHYIDLGTHFSVSTACRSDKGRGKLSDHREDYGIVVERCGALIWPRGRSDGGRSC